ncbi:ABC transporter substrate-binding protein [Solibacillus sp. FSL K6-1523]|uniref:ABC transporter substrate-binding protein n=1 Tax=Solibacillus sp. FSL K6-1523 TaxID=2921471 RepID=UPI0030F509C0
MKKIQSLAMLFLMAMLVLVGCGTGDSKPTTNDTEQNKTAKGKDSAAAQFPVTVTDSLGREIALEKQPERIISLAPSNTEILFGLGLNEEIVGVSDNDTFPEQATTKEKVGGMEFNLELIASLKPDIVFAHESGMYNFEKGMEQLEAMGIAVFVVKNTVNFEETYETMKQIGQLTGKVAQADEMVATMQKDIEEMTTKAVGLDGKSAFIVVGTNPDLYAVGTGTFINEMLHTVGVKNSVTQPGWLQYSAEQFVSDNPEVILVTYEDDIEAILSNPAYAEMDAVKSGNVHLIDADTTSRQGPRIVEGIQSIAQTMYPEVFGE